jgi:hypothetical protein
LGELFAYYPYNCSDGFISFVAVTYQLIEKGLNFSGDSQRWAGKEMVTVLLVPIEQSFFIRGDTGGFLPLR